MNNNEKPSPAVISKLAQGLGCSEAEVMQAINGNSPQQLLSKLDPTKAQQANNLMSDPEKLKKLMESPQAQALLKKLSGGG